MRLTTTRPGRSRPRDTVQRYSMRQTLAVTAALAAAVVAGALAVLHPGAAVATAVAAGLAVVARPATRTLRRRLAARRREGRTREVCVPATGVCVEA